MHIEFFQYYLDSIFSGVYMTPELSTRQELKKIYAYLNHSEEKLLEILLRFYQNQHEDILIGFFFENKDLAHIAQMQMGFLLKAWGIQETYSGKTPGKAHNALPPILGGHFDRRIKILESTLESFQIPTNLISTWIKFETSFRDLIVTKT